MLARTRTPAKNSKTTGTREMIQRSVCFVAEMGQFQVKSSWSRCRVVALKVPAAYRPQFGILRGAGAGVEGQVDVLAGGLGCYPFCWMNHCCACWPTPWSRPAVQDQLLRKRVGSFRFQVSMSWPLTGRVMMRPNPRARR